MSLTMRSHQFEPRLTDERLTLNRQPGETIGPDRFDLQG